MITLIFSPRWFFGVDITFELLGVLVTFLIGLTAYKYYRFSSEDRYKYLALSFWAFTSSYLAKIGVNYVLYFQQTVKAAVGSTLVKMNLLDKSQFFLQAGYDVHRFLMLMGLLGVYWLVSRSKDQEHKWLLMFMLFLITLFSFNAYFVFHVTTSLMLVFILKHYYPLCFRSRKRNMHAHLNFAAFSALLASQILFIFVIFNNIYYVIAQGSQLLGFLIFLVNLIMLVFGHGKKKNKN